MKRKMTTGMAVLLAAITLAGCGSSKQVTTDETTPAVEATAAPEETAAVEETTTPEETQAPEETEAVAEEQPNVMVSTDNKYQMTFPSDWAPATGELNVDFTLEAMAESQDYILMAISEPSQDLAMDLAQYTDTLVNMTQEGLTNGVVGDKQEIAIGDKTGYCTRLDGTVESINLTYYIYTVQTDTDFMQILGWSAASEADNAKAIYDQIVSTFQTI